MKNSDKVDACYTQDKWRTHFCFVISLQILEQLAEAFVTCKRLKSFSMCVYQLPDHVL